MSPSPNTKDQVMWFIVKLNFLLLGLGIVLFLIFRLEKGLPDPIRGVLGLPAPAEVTSRGLGWCETRVKEVRFGPGDRVYQIGMKWMRESSDGLNELNFLEVEKWFGQHCRVKVVAAEAKSSDPMPLVLATVVFLDDSRENFELLGAGRLIWQNQIYFAPRLIEAFNQLRALPDVDSGAGSH